MCVRKLWGAQKLYVMGITELCCINHPAQNTQFNYYWQMDCCDSENKLKQKQKFWCKKMRHDNFSVYLEWKITILMIQVQWMICVDSNLGFIYTLHLFWTFPQPQIRKNLARFVYFDTAIKGWDFFLLFSIAGKMMMQNRDRNNLLISWGTSWVHVKTASLWQGTH